MSARHTHPSDGIGLAAAPRSHAASGHAASPRDNQRVIVENLKPSVDDGRFAIKRCVGDVVTVHADVFTDGHDILTVILRHRLAGAADWIETPMEPHLDDLWSGVFTVTVLGLYEFSVVAWANKFETWRSELATKFEAGQAVSSELLEGAAWLRSTETRATAPDREWLKAQARLIASDDDVERLYSLPAIETD